MGSIAQLESEGRYDELIRTLHDMVVHDKNVLRDDTIRAWSSRRWRDLFLKEAVKDERAVDTAIRFQRLGTDRRSDRQRVSERYLKDEFRSAWKDELPPAFDGTVSNTTLVFCPGLANGGVSVPAFHPGLSDAEDRFGIRVIRADCHPMRGCVANTADVLRAVRDGLGLDAAGNQIPDDEATPTVGRLMFIGYSKGMPDAMEFVARHPEYADRTAVMFGWAGAAGGTPMAGYAMRLAKSLRLKEETVDITNARKMLSHVLPADVDENITLDRLDEYNFVEAVHELTPKVRRAFLAEYRDYFDEKSIFFFHAAAATHVFDAPLSQIPLYLRLKQFHRKNDMQLTTIDTAVPYPMSSELALLNAHHWDVAFGPFSERKRLNHLYHPFPTDAAGIAMVQLSAELGLID